MFPRRNSSCPPNNNNNLQQSFTFSSSNNNNNNNNGGSSSSSTSGTTIDPKERLNSNNNKPQQPSAKIYKPFIYSYTCRGAYSAYSDYRPPSSNTNTSVGSSSSNNNQIGNGTKQHGRSSEGVCHGFRTRLELIQDMEESTRVTAIKQFASLSDEDTDDDNEYNVYNSDHHHDTRNTPGTTTSGQQQSDQWMNHQTKAIVVSPALIFKDDDDYNDENNNEKDNKKNKKKKVINLLQSKKEQLPEEELIKRQSWVCYGSTEVDYLVLRDLETGQQKIAAVAPRTTGVSVRKIEAAHDNSSITSIGIGNILNIVFDMGPSNSMFNDNENTNEQDQPRNIFPRNSNNNNTNEQQSSDPQQQKSRTTTILSSSDTLKSIETGVVLTAAYSKKIINQMEQNIGWVYDTMQDDFLNRTYSAGTKIVHQIPKTVTSTTNYMHKMVTKLLDENNNNDDNNDE